MLGIANLPVRTTLLRADAAVTHRRHSLYEVLRVNRHASQSEIKMAYRALAKLYHPDARSRFMDSAIVSQTDYFVEINRAYATLSDPQTRAIYDSNVVLFDSRPGMVIKSGYSPTRRWETDQCW